MTAGRPNKIADDTGGRFAARPRVAWLLRMSRLYGRDPELAVARRCATAFPRPVTPSQISRWENGVLPAPYPVISAYEHVLGLPPGHLTAAVDTVHQVRSVRPGAPRLDRGFTPDDQLAARLDDLLDCCLGGAPVRGVDWDGLSACVLAFPHAYLPRPAWETLVGRLLAEMSVSRGRDYHHRWEALRRLQGHSVARTVIARAVTEMVADPASQIVVDPLMLLVHDRQATRLLVDEVAVPTSARTLHAALDVCELAAEAGRFGGADATNLGALARAYLSDTGTPAHLRRAATNLITKLTPHTRPWPGHELSPVRASAVSALAISAESALDMASRGTSAGENRMLNRLVGELLFSDHVDVRLGAAAVLAASPFRGPLADALADAVSAGNPSLVSDHVGALSTIGGAEHRRPLETLLAGDVSDAVSNAVAAQVAFGLGNLPGHTDPAVLLHTIRRYGTRDGAAEVLRALLYTAGMQRATAVLAEVRGWPDLPADVRAAARWWVTQLSRVPG